MTKNNVQFRFKSVGDKPERTKKWLLFPVSLIFHGLIVAALIIQPLLNAEKELPEVRYVTLIAAIQPPAVKPPPVGGKKGKKKAKRNKERKEERRQQVVQQQRFVAPVQIPEEIEEEELDANMLGLFEGSGEGVEGSAFEGLPGGDGGVSGLIGGTDPDDAPIPVSSVKTPRLIRRISPQYPNAARIARIQGTVVIEAVTDIYGKVVRVKVVNGHPMLKNAAMAAVRQWIYEPYIINGVPKPVTFYARVHFTLNSN